jgi:ABC-type transport system involved in multi-copper enzyme maturation permease subunit
MSMPIVFATLLGLASALLAVLAVGAYRRNTLEALKWSYEGSKWTFLTSLLASLILASAHTLGTYAAFIGLDILLLAGWYAAAHVIRARRDVLWSARTDEIAPTRPSSVGCESWTPTALNTSTSR